MSNKNFEIIEHTADIGIRVRSADLKALFSSCAAAMFSIIAQPSKLLKPKPHIFNIGIKAQNYEDLLVNWLNELLSLSAVEEMVFDKFRFVEFDQQHLIAEVYGFDNTNYKINTEIKAATYHQLKVEKTPAGWMAEIIFDV